MPGIDKRARYCEELP